MSMTRREWSLSALSVELATDRRTLGKRLQHVPPVSIQHCGNRIEKRWLLRDVLPFVDGKNEPQQSMEESAHDVMKQWAGTEMVPKLLDAPEFVSVLTHKLIDEHRFSKVQALQAYSAAAMALMCALTAGFKDEHMKFMIPDDSLVNKVANKSQAELQAFIDETWPDDA